MQVPMSFLNASEANLEVHTSLFGLASIEVR
jgi:hypothetical protein